MDIHRSDVLICKEMEMINKNSRTPRTNSAIDACGHCHNTTQYRCNCEFVAKELEIELNTIKEERDQVIAQRDMLLKALEEAVKHCPKNTQFSDWIESIIKNVESN